MTAPTRRVCSTRALEAADWKGFKARRKAAKQDGKLRGIGLALFLEPSGGMGKEQVEIRDRLRRQARDVFQRRSVGAGARDRFPGAGRRRAGLSRRPDRDARTTTSATPKFLGTGTFGSRSLICHGAALQACAKEIVEKGKKLAAGELEVAPTDVTFDKGQYRVTGTDLSISIKSLIEKKWGQPTHPLDTNTTFDLAFAYPERRAHRRGRDRSGHRRVADRELRGGRRLRQHLSITRWSRASCTAD